MGATVGRCVERGPAVVVGFLRVGATGDEELDHVDLARVGVSI